MMDAITETAALLAYTLLTFAVGLGPVLLGCFINDRTGRAWAGWLVGGATMIGSIALCAATLGTLWEVHCRTAHDFQACMEGD